MKNPKFEIYTTRAGKFRFKLCAVNGQTILTSQSYSSKASAKKGIASVMKNAADEDRFVRAESKDGQFYFNLTAANKQIVGTSERYKTKASCTNGIKAVMRDAPKSGTLDTTKK
jgi:uncharacterized protein YegP (UPF0339 family)